MTSNEVQNVDHVEIVSADAGPLFSAEELAAIETIANGGTVEGVNVSELDAAIVKGINENAKKGEDALRDLAGYVDAALKLRTWARQFDPETNELFASEVRFVDFILAKYPILTHMHTSLRRELLTVINTITDEKGRALSHGRMAKLLNVGKQTVVDDRKLMDGEGGSDAERGPQDGGQDAPSDKAVKRFVTSLTSNAAKVRDAETSMTPEQLLIVAAEGRDLATTALATLRLSHPEVELPDWAAAFPSPTGPGRLRSGAEGTVATGPVLAGAPVDPTGIAAPAPSPKTVGRRANGPSKAAAAS